MRSFGNVPNFNASIVYYPELLSSAPSIDHLQPQSLGGSDETFRCSAIVRRYIR
ncbi:hypothetical protein ACKFKF_02945 [Phormidesmis sp. 146-12]